MHPGRPPHEDEGRDQAGAKEGQRSLAKAPEAGRDTGQMVPHHPQKAPTLPMPWSQTCSLQNGQDAFLSLKPPS